MFMKYLTMSDKLTGEYKEAFEKVEFYASLHHISEVVIDIMYFLSKSG